MAFLAHEMDKAKQSLMDVTRSSALSNYNNPACKTRNDARETIFNREQNRQQTYTHLYCNKKHSKRDENSYSNKELNKEFQALTDGGGKIGV